MKRPYAQGDWFGVPLGGGRFAAGIVTAGSRNVIGGYFFGPAVDALPLLHELVALRPSQAWWRGRFSDRALVQQSWPRIGAQPSFDSSDWPEPGGVPAEPGFVESALEARRSGGRHARSRLHVADVRAPFLRAAFDALPNDARVQWREPLAARDLELAVRWLHERPGATLRLYGAAATQLGSFDDGALPERLELDAAHVPLRLPVFTRVRDLSLDGVPADVGAVLAAFPHVRTLRVVARGHALCANVLARAPLLERLSMRAGRLQTAAALANAPHLRALELCDVTLDDDAAPARLPQLRALRLRRIPGLRSIGALSGHAALQTLCLEELLYVDDVRAIATLPRLESLALTGMWQLELAGVEFIAGLRGLRALRLDIGGRRKNVEIYRRLNLPKPAPFDVGAL